MQDADDNEFAGFLIAETPVDDCVVPDEPSDQPTLDTAKSARAKLVEIVHTFRLPDGLLAASGDPCDRRIIESALHHGNCRERLKQFVVADLAAQPWVVSQRVSVEAQQPDREVGEA